MDKIIKPGQTPDEFLRGDDAKYLLVALTLSLLREPLLSGDHKWFIFARIESMLTGLGVSEDEAKRMARIMEKLRTKFQTTNSFMG